MFASTLLSALVLLPAFTIASQTENIDLVVRDTGVPRRLAHTHAHRRLAAAQRSASHNLTEEILPGGDSKRSSGYELVEHWGGSTFFDNWNFYTNDDPTQGLVDYVSESTAKADNLAYVSDNVAYMKVDSTTNLGSGQKRKSVRIASSKRFDGGLFIADIKHMPAGLATWPAFWTVGADWPNHGEIDIIEGINTNTQNQYTVHSAPGCEIDTSSSAPLGFKVSSIASSVGHTSCGSSKSSNTGCAFVDKSDSSFGAPFNAAGGSVVAMEWTSEGIKIWNFPRGNVPSDITNSPNPDGWSPTYLKAAWSSLKCDTKTFFKQHAVTFDTTLCGDWAGAAYPGGKSKCNAYVETGSHFTEAYWAINSVSVFQT
jgi:hypothetical protein